MCTPRSCSSSSPAFVFAYMFGFVALKQGILVSLTFFNLKVYCSLLERIVPQVLWKVLKTEKIKMEILRSGAPEDEADKAQRSWWPADHVTSLQGCGDQQFCPTLTSSRFLGSQRSSPKPLVTCCLQSTFAQQNHTSQVPSSLSFALYLEFSIFVTLHCSICDFFPYCSKSPVTPLLQPNSTSHFSPKSFENIV